MLNIYHANPGKMSSTIGFQARVTTVNLTAIVDVDSSSLLAHSVSWLGLRVGSQLALSLHSFTMVTISVRVKPIRR